MDFVEEETRPRVLFHSRSASTATSSPTACSRSSLIKTPTLTACLCFASSSILLFSAFYFFLSSQTLNFLLTWISLSLLLGPFAPTFLTGGDITVGHGEPLEEPPEADQTDLDQLEEPKKRGAGRRKQPRSDAPLPYALGYEPVPAVKVDKRNAEPVRTVQGQEMEEKEWSEEDFEILKKQISKHPVGTPRRWEIIAEAFRGRHEVESVIRTAKSLSERRPTSGNSFEQFLRQRKPLDRRVDLVNVESSDAVAVDSGDRKGNADSGSSNWNSAEDLALLSALKAFPKDVPLRWEKITAAVPGKSKALCMKRVAELKKDFRHSKSSVA